MLAMTLDVFEGSVCRCLASHNQTFKRLRTSLCVLLNSATAVGKFLGPAVLTTQGSGPHDVVINDLNGDGRADIATTNLGTNTIGVLLNTGTF